MNTQEYEQKMRECFVQFCKDNGIDQEVNISIFDAFDQIFDRAYAFGKKIGNSDFSDAEEEGMLTVSRKRVQEMYAANERIKADFPDKETAHISDHINHVLKHLFGSKCLPDELNEDNFAKSEPKPAEPKNEGTRQKQYVPKNAESGTHSFSHILKDDFRDHNRLHIAAQITASIYSNDKTASRFDSIEALVRKALDITDTLIAEAERTDKLNK